MPGLQLDKLRLESANLVGKFSKPDLFRYELLELLDFYSNRTFRASQVTLPGKLLSSYHVPDRVIWQIKKDLEAQIASHTQAAGLDCAALLWKGESIEEMTLAVYILGRVSTDPPETVIDTLLAWYKPDLDPILRNMLVSDGLTNIRRDYFDLWVELIRGWIDSDDPRQTAQAYQALTGLLAEEGDQHLPSVIRLVRENLFNLPADLHPEALQLLQAMIRTSAVESRFLLRQFIQSAPVENALQKRLLRKMVDLFPEPGYSDLRREYIGHYKVRE
jgi:hypothetical protein